MPKIVINKDVCKGCGLCVRACPKGVIELGKEINKSSYKYAVPVNDNCIGCKACALTCPDIAIEVFK